LLHTDTCSASEDLQEGTTAHVTVTIIIIIIIIIERRDFNGIMSNDCKDTLQTQNKTARVDAAERAVYLSNEQST